MEVESQPGAEPGNNLAPEPEITATQESEPPQPEKTFTQAELDEIVEKRLNRERRKLEKFERQREVEDAVRADRERRTPPPATDAAPKREDFETLEDYLEAKADYKVEQKLAEADEKREEKEREREAQRSAADRRRTWDERASKAAEKYEDFDEVVRARDLQITPPMAEAIAESELGTEVAYYLGKNPEEAERISKLGPIAQIREIGRLEARFDKEPEKPVSRAAKPVEPVGSGKGSDGGIHEPGLSTEEFVRRRNRELKAKGN